MAHDNAGIEQHPDRHEEQHREGVAQRQRLLRGALAERRLAQDHAGEEGTERERDLEESCRPVGDAERNREHREAEQLARAGMRHVMQEPRNDAAPDHPHQGKECHELAKRDRERQRDGREV